MAIEREKILDAALALLNDVGLDQFTTRRLAERLGVQQPALYWHFKNKSELLDAMNGLMLSRYHADRLPSPGESWEDFTIANAHSHRRALLAVRNGARLNAGTRPTTREFSDAERQLQLYVDAGFTAHEAFSIAISVSRYVVGFVLEEQDERDRADDGETEWGDGDPLGEVAPYPILSTALRPLLEGGSINTIGVFDAGLSYMVAGMRQSLARNLASRAPAPARAPRRRTPRS